MRRRVQWEALYHADFWGIGFSMGGCPVTVMLRLGPFVLQVWFTRARIPIREFYKQLQNEPVRRRTESS